jgi:hypothetical protein
MEISPEINTNQLKIAEAVLAIGKGLITTAIQQSAADQLQCEEVIKKASAEIDQAQTLIFLAQSSSQPQYYIEY